EASQPIPATIRQMAAALRPPFRIIALSPLGLARRHFDWHETLRRLNLNRIHALRKQKGKNQSGSAPVKSTATARHLAARHVLANKGSGKSRPPLLDAKAPQLAFLKRQE